MADFRYYETVEQAMYGWLAGAIPDSASVVYANQTEKKSTRISSGVMVAYAIIGSRQETGIHAQKTHDLDDNFDMIYRREITVTVDVIGKTALEVVEAIQNSVYKPTVLAAFRDDGVGFRRMTEPVDLSGLRDSVYEPRYKIDTYWGIQTTDSDGIGYFDKITGDNNITTLGSVDYNFRAEK